MPQATLAQREEHARAVTALGIVAPPPIQIEGPRFVGSLATLFTFVRDRRVDLKDVALHPICEACLEYLLAGNAANLEEAAAALTALAYLLERKAWGLLPTLEPGPEFDEALELPPPSAYLYAGAVQAMGLWHEERACLFFRAANLGPNPYEVPYELEELTAKSLAAALAEVLERAAPPAPPEVYRHKQSLAHFMMQVLLALSYEFKTLSVLVPQNATREDAVLLVSKFVGVDPPRPSLGSIQRERRRVRPRMTDVVDAVHALLFASEAPVSAVELASPLSLTEGQVEQALEVLRERLDNHGPIQLIRIAEGFQLSTKPEFLNVIAELLKPRRQKMSRSLLEVLAIVAYRQPVTAAEVDAVRGVQSDHSLRTLVDRRMIQDVGRRRAPGRPLLYGTTRQFLHAFKLKNLQDLPAIEEKLTLSPQQSPAPLNPHDPSSS